MKWVRVMADYSSDGLWHHDGTMMERDELPISAELQARHEQWCHWYEKSEGPSSKHGSEPSKTFDYAGFSKEGKEIARAIKMELPDWTVIYFDEEAALSTVLKIVREDYEYEIKL